MKLLIKSLIITVGLTVFLFLPVACRTPQLDQAGVYQGKQFWFASDRTLLEAKDDLSAFLKWEMANRPALKAQKLEGVTKAAENIRTNAPQWFKAAAAARDAYTNALFGAAGPSTIIQTSNALQQAVALVQTARIGAQGITNSVKLP